MKGQELSHHLSDVFRKISKQGFAQCILCQKDINYANKGSHALQAHCQTEVHKEKVQVMASKQFGYGVKEWVGVRIQKTVNLYLLLF